MSGLDEIAQRKQQLVERSNQHRTEMARIYYQWQAKSLVARQVGSLLTNPLVLTGMGLVLLKLPWRKLYKTSGWIWKGWKLLQLVRRVVI